MKLRPFSDADGAAAECLAAASREDLDGCTEQQAAPQIERQAAEFRFLKQAVPRALSACGCGDA